MWPIERRQSIACGYEQRVEFARPLIPASYSSVNRDRKRLPTVCPGYTASLPHVVERTWHAHWAETPHLAGRLGHEIGPHDFREIELLAAQRGAAESWSMANPVKKS